MPNQSPNDPGRGSADARFYLASRSPRRRDLLNQLGAKFALLDVEIDESFHTGERPEDYVRRMAVEKARAAARTQPSPALPILAADTSVVLGEQVFGKPESLADATRMLGLLSGRTHQVITAVSFIDNNQQECIASCSDVTFKPLTSAEIQAYWNSEEPLGKAGSYAIQGFGGSFVTGIAGSYSGIVGLPLFETAELLRKFGCL